MLGYIRLQAPGIRGYTGMGSWVYMYIFIYIYKERERERERDGGTGHIGLGSRDFVVIVVRACEVPKK